MVYHFLGFFLLRNWKIEAQAISKNYGCSEIFRSFRACNLAMTVRWWWLVVQNWTCTFMRATLKTFSGEERNSFLGVRSVLDEHYKTIKLWCHTVNEGLNSIQTQTENNVHKCWKTIWLNNAKNYQLLSCRLTLYLNTYSNNSCL